MSEPKPLPSGPLEPDAAPAESGAVLAREVRDVLLVEDHPEAARGLRAVVRDAFVGASVHWVSSLGGAGEVLEQRPCLDLALIDLGLPDGSGIDLLARLRDRRPEILCIVTTIYDDDAHLFPALSAGAAGYLLKEQGPEALTLHLRALAQGIPALSPRVARRMLAHFQRQSSPEPVEVPRDALLSSPSGRGAGQPGALTRRETEVLSLIARGLQRGEAARVLGVSENTVAKFIKDIYRKLNISSRAEAALEASRRGLL